MHIPESKTLLSSIFHASQHRSSTRLHVCHDSSRSSTVIENPHDLRSRMDHRSSTRSQIVDRGANFWPINNNEGRGCRTRETASIGGRFAHCHANVASELCVSRHGILMPICRWRHDSITRDSGSVWPPFMSRRRWKVAFSDSWCVVERGTPLWRKTTSPRFA